MEEGLTIGKVPDWMEIKPGMMRYPIREHDKVGSTLTAEENNHIAMQLGFEISEAK